MISFDDFAQELEVFVCRQFKISILSSFYLSTKIMEFLIYC